MLSYVNVCYTIIFFFVHCVVVLFVVVRACTIASLPSNCQDQGRPTFTPEQVYPPLNTQYPRNRKCSTPCRYSSFLLPSGVALALRVCALPTGFLPWAAQQLVFNLCYVSHSFPLPRKNAYELGTEHPVKLLKLYEMLFIYTIMVHTSMFLHYPHITTPVY